MIEKLQGREVINPHAIGKKVNEMVDFLNEMFKESSPASSDQGKNIAPLAVSTNNQESPSESDKTQTNSESIKKEGSV